MENPNCENGPSYEGEDDAAAFSNAIRLGKTMSLQEWCKYQIERREGMSDAPTPRTEEEYYKSCGSGHYGQTVPIDFARQLEQECDEARDRLAELLAFLLKDFQPGMTTRGYREAVENACALLGVSCENVNVDLPDTAAQDSASKSNNPAVSG